MTIYKIKNTDVTESGYVVNESAQNTGDLDVALFGRVKLEYGGTLNENLLHLLENFACPSLSTDPDAPDISIAIDDLLENPTYGQLWFNTTANAIYFWNGQLWIQLMVRGAVASNWGRICHGEQIPAPIDQLTGLPHSYDNCVWSVTPATTTAQFRHLKCTTDENGFVYFKYETMDGRVVNGDVNYVIISVPGNITKNIPLQSRLVGYDVNTDTEHSGYNQIVLEGDSPTTDNVGISCINGAPTTCNGSDEVAPSTINKLTPRLYVNGGTPPYTVKVVYKNGTVPPSECFSIGFGTNAIITDATANNELLGTLTLANSGAYLDSGELYGNCRQVNTEYSGDILLIIRDHDGVELIETLGWSVKRETPTTPTTLSMDVVGYNTPSGAETQELTLFKLIGSTAAGDTTGIDCNTGTPLNCNALDIAPHNTNSRKVRVYAHGGTPPYKVSVTHVNHTVGEEMPPGECVHFGFDPTCTLVTSTTPNNTNLIEVDIPTNGGHVDSGVSTLR